MSRPEELLLAQVKEAGLPDPVAEFQFWPGRRFRFDLAWPDRMIACEVEGGTWIQGRHSRGKGFEMDCEKYGEAVARGWAVVRCTSGMVEDGRAVTLLRRLLELSDGVDRPSDEENASQDE